MTPAEFRQIRQKLGLSQERWGRALGYSGRAVTQHVWNIEHGRPKAPITLHVARLARMYELYGVPEEFLP